MDDAQLRKFARILVEETAAFHEEKRAEYCQRIAAEKAAQTEQNIREWELRERSDSRIVDTIDAVFRERERMRRDTSGFGDRDAWQARSKMLGTMISEELPALQLRPDEDITAELAEIRHRAGLPPLPPT